jgi:outer membrane protein assembly factor BamB
MMYVLYAVDPNGIEQWAFPTGGMVHRHPAIGTDGTIYAGSTDYNLYAINPDGTQQWAFLTGGQVISSPAIGSDGTIYVGSEDYNLHAINPDGNQQWAFPTGCPVYSSPAIGTDGTIFVGSNNGNLYAVGANGNQRWTFPTGAGIWSSPAIGSDGTIYIGSTDNKLYAIDICTVGLADTPWPMFHHDERHTGSPEPLINTPIGNNVIVNPVDQTTGTSPVTVTFELVTEAGLTNLSTSAEGPPLTTGFKLGYPPVYYDLTTTAGYSGQIEVCINYSGVSFVNEEDLQLFHYDDSSNTWIDVTSSLDTDNNIICGIVTSLSLFAIFEPSEMEAGKHKRLAIEALSALFPTGDKKNDQRIQKAIKHIEKSLAPYLWEDDSHLTKKGKKVFREEKEAVKHLQKLINDKKVADSVKDICENVTDELLTADKLLAETALNDAKEYQGTDKKSDKEIEKSEKELEKATKELEKGKPDKAIDHYKKACEHAQKAMK